MYHPGKVIEIFSTGKEIKTTDNSIQVALEMWDENVLTFNISSKLGGTVDEGDIVIVDYGPVSVKNQLPKHEIVKVLKGSKGKKMWKKYKDFLNARKPSATTTPVVQKPNIQYIG